MILISSEPQEAAAPPRYLQLSDLKDRATARKLEQSGLIQPYPTHPQPANAAVKSTGTVATSEPVSHNVQNTGRDYEGGWTPIPTLSGASDPGILAEIISITAPYLTWPSLLALRRTCTPVLSAVDSYLTVPHLTFSIQPPERPTALLISARINSHSRLLPFFNASRSHLSPQQTLSLRCAREISLSGRMHPIVNRLLTLLSPDATVIVGLLTGTAQVPLRLPSIRRLIVSEEQVSAWSSLALGLNVMHAAAEVEVHIPLTGEAMDWRIGPLLSQAGFSGIVQLGTQVLRVRARGRVTTFLEALPLVFPAPMRLGLRVVIELSTSDWCDRFTPVGVVAQRVATTLGTDSAQVTVQLENESTLSRQIQKVAKHHQNTSKGIEQADDQGSIEDWEVDGE